MFIVWYIPLLELLPPDAALNLNLGEKPDITIGKSTSAKALLPCDLNFFQLLVGASLVTASKAGSLAEELYPVWFAIVLNLAPSATKLVVITLELDA